MPRRRDLPCSGPPTRAFPWSVSAAASLYRNYDRDLPYCFNRKEAKDHGEGGSMVGYKPQDGDRVAIVEDVVTAGTAVRESIELFKHVAEVNIKALVRQRGPDGAGHPGVLHPGRAAGGLRHRRSAPSSPCGRSFPSSTTAPSTARSILTTT